MLRRTLLRQRGERGVDEPGSRSTDRRWLDTSVFQVIALACVSIAIALIVMGWLSYLITQKATIEKLQTSDLPYIVQSIAAKIDGRMTRANETAAMLATDPTIKRWIEGYERDPELGEAALRRIGQVVTNYDYMNSFVVSNLTRQYWTESGQMLDYMRENDPDDSWFFSTLAANKPLSISIDYNQERENTFVFVNALMGEPGRPIAITGVGLDLEDLAQQVATYQFGPMSDLWLIDGAGEIHLAEDPQDRGHNIAVFLPPSTSQQIIRGTSDRSSFGVLAYETTTGEMMDLIYQPLRATDWCLVLQIPRRETTSFLNSIKVNTLVVAGLALILMTVIFYLISSKIANPYRRMMVINHELDEKVQARTAELREKNERIMDSIDYAERLQKAIIPSDEELSQAFRDHFVIWRPRDVVGGDFYWLKSGPERTLMAVADCTGHGVPGALMTMTVSSILKYVVDEVSGDDPATIVREVNWRLRDLLHKERGPQAADDGVDIGICVFQGDQLTFAGARIPLYLMQGGQLQVISADRQSLGYRRSDPGHRYHNTSIRIQPGDRFYMATDGFVDQNGGEKDRSLGRSRWLELVSTYGTTTLAQQKEAYERALTDHMQSNPQRDDITVVGVGV